MKVKLSRSQWEQIGKQAEWIKESAKKASAEPTVTPIIKKSRTIVQEYEICPHCEKEIMEKSIFGEQIGDTWFIYHGACREKGPIQKITREDSKRALKEALGE